MDLHASRLVHPVTEYSATKGSSGFSSGYWPSMDMAGMLPTLEQGSRPLEDYIQEYLGLAHFSDLPDCVLIDFFCEGINQPLKSQLIREGPRSSLSQFLDYALLTVGSTFTVGVAEEERDTASVTEMADAPECTHKMVDATTHRNFSADLHESSQVTVDVKEPSQVPADVKEPGQVPADVKEPGPCGSGVLWNKAKSAEQEARAEAVCELSPCPVTARKAVCELSPCPVTAKEAVCESLSCPVMAMEAVCKPLSCPVTAMEAACDSLSCPVTAMEAVCDSPSCPVTAREAACDSQTCPATVPETMKALPVLSVSALPVLSVSALPVLSVSVPPRSQILPWFPARSAFLRWSSASVWWSGGLLLGSGGLPLRPGGLWSRLLRPGGLWSRLLRPGGLQFHPLRPGGLQFHPLRPGFLLCRLCLVPQHSTSTWTWPSVPPPVPPPLHRPPGLFRSVWKPLLGGGGAMSQILAMNFCSLTTRGHSPITLTFTPHRQLQITQRLHFPSSTAPTQLFALITHTPENNLTLPWLHCWSHNHAL